MYLPADAKDTNLNMCSKAFFIRVKIFLGIVLLFSIPAIVSAQVNTLLIDSLLPMSFSELTIGPDVRHAQGNYKINTNAIAFSNTALGLTARMQSSFIKNYLLAERSRRLQVLDVLACEISAGGLSSSRISKSAKAWLAYRFEFGFATVWHVNTHNDLGATFTLLRFSRDQVSQNISGSDIKVRYRYKALMVEAGAEVRRDRIVGWLSALAGNKEIPLQYMMGVRCLLPGGEQAGIRCELLSGNRNSLQTEGELYNNIWSLKLFYGIYF